MAAMYRLKGLGWLASCAVVAIGFYLVSSQVAAERKRLEQVDRRIGAAKRDIRALETEFDVRANLAQLERWNGDTLALTVPVAAQFVRDERALADLSPIRGPLGGGEVQTAALIVPSTPSIAPPAVTPAPPSAPAPRQVVTVRVAAVRAPAAARLTPAVATRASEQPRAMKAVAMVDKSLLSDSTLGDLLSGARNERGRLR